MTTERIMLKPGVWLQYVQTDRFKTGCFSFNLLRPLARSDAAPNALLPTVLLRGCSGYPDMQAISRRLDTLYGASTGTLVRKKGEIQSVGLYADFLEDRYAGGAPLFSDMLDLVGRLLFEPVTENGGFAEAFVDSERQNLEDTIAARINEKRSYAIHRLLQHMCRGEAYAVPRLGEADTLTAVSGQNLLARWRQLLAQAPVELFYLGQQPRDAVLEQLRALTDRLPAGERASVPATQVLLLDRPAETVEEAMDVTQGKLTLGLRTDITVRDPRYPALMLLNAVYGAGMTSKLFLKIREEQSLCYYASSSLDKFKGVMVVGSGIEFEKFQVARDGILGELQACQQGEITGEELEAARNYLISGLRTGCDSPGRLDDYALGQAVAGLDGTMEDLARQLKTVTKDQVVEAAQSLRLDTIYFLKGVQA